MKEDFWLILHSSDSDSILKLMRIDVVSLVISSHISIDNFRGQIDRAVRKMNKTTFPYDKLSSNQVQSESQVQMVTQITFLFSVILKNTEMQNQVVKIVTSF